MARSHAKFYVRAWRDEEWRNLGMAAQWLYWALLTQPKLTLVGSLEVSAGRWSQLAANATKDEVQAALDELVAAGKVLLDESTDELLIRAFCKNDLDPNRVNVNLAKGLWGQWACIESHRLRIAAVDGMPDELWEKVGQHAPVDAVDIRRSARLGPEEPARLEPGVRTSRLDDWFEPPPSSHLSTDASRRPAVPTSHPQVLGLVGRTDALAARITQEGRGEGVVA